MSTYHYAANNPVMFNDPMGDQVNESENYSDYQAVYFHGGYKRIGHASGNHWSNELDAPPLGPFAEFWSDFLTSAVDGRHSGSFSGGAISSIYDIWSGLVNGEGFGIDYRDDGSVGVQTNRYIASSDGSGNSNITIAGANHIVDQHTEESSKYGHIISAYTFSAGLSLASIGGMYERGMVFTDKGWARTYQTKYYAPGFDSPSFSLGVTNITPTSSSYKPTFMDWQGAMVGFAASYEFISGNIGITSTYFAWGFGVSIAPASLRIPSLKELKLSGSMNVGVTTWTSQPSKLNHLLLLEPLTDI